MIEVWKHYHVYYSNVIAPTFQRARTRRKMYQIHRIRPGAQSYSYYLARWHGTTPILSSGVRYYQYFQESWDNHWGDHPLMYNFLAECWKSGPDVRYISSVCSTFSDGIVLEQSYYNRIPFLVSTTCVGCIIK